MIGPQPGAGPRGPELDGSELFDGEGFPESIPRGPRHGDCEERPAKHGLGHTSTGPAEAADGARERSVGESHGVSE